MAITHEQAEKAARYFARRFFDQEGRPADLNHAEIVAIFQDLDGALDGAAAAMNGAIRSELRGRATVEQKAWILGVLALARAGMVRDLL